MILFVCYSGDVDVVYGCIVLGWLVDLLGVECMVGFFINSLLVWV